MKKKQLLLKFFFLTCFFSLGNIIMAVEWEKKEASIMTRWSENIDPDNIHNEYPRPQMRRADWVNLNGIWELGKNTVQKDFIIPTAAQADNIMWKYITGDAGFTVAEGWNSVLGYDDSGWKEGAAGFGRYTGIVRTEWGNSTIYLRKKIQIDNLTTEELNNLMIEIFYDEDFELYINGVLASSKEGYTTSYVTLNISEEAKKAIKPGKENLIAIKCIQKAGDQYIDLGLFVEREQLTFGNYRGDQLYDKKILVPFAVESPLSGIMDTDYNDTKKWYSYKRHFTVPETMKDKQILLHFGAVDWHSVVFLNGELIGEHKGGYDPFYFNITGKLKPTGQQELVVHTFDPTTGGQPNGKQIVNPKGIWYTPTSGIWQTVWFEAVEPTYINDFTIIPDIDNNQVYIQVQAESTDASTEVEVIVSDKGTEVARQTIKVAANTEIKINNPKLWSPETPFLYDLKFTLKKSGAIVDNIDSYFGMRKISLGKLRGKPYMFLNNEPVFQHGPLDQGFWPDGIHTAPSYEALRYDLLETKKLGFNMTRKHIKVEPARWYYYCDSIGLLVWQDMPSAMTHGNPEESALGDKKWQKENFYDEMKRMIRNLKNYPSIVVWVPYNEGWGQYAESPEHTRNGFNTVREIDNSRLINAVSGWTNYELGDIIDNHDYTLPSLYPNPFNHRATACGETGGFSLQIDDHIWDVNADMYVTLKNSEELTQKLEELHDMSFVLSHQDLSALVYTQLTDVEQELNGLITYDREVIKMDEPQLARFRTGAEKMQTTSLRGILPTSMQSSMNFWKYTTGDAGFTVADGWNTEPGYDDSGWNEGAAGFGQFEDPGWGKWARVQTPWTNETIYLRKKIVLDGITEADKDKLKLLIYHDEDFELYINGILASSAPEYKNRYEFMDLTPEGRNAIRPGEENLFAIKCIQIGGGQYIDIGLCLEIPLNEEFPEKPEPTYTEIYNTEQFLGIRNNLSGFYKLMADIDLGNISYEPIGTSANTFKGVLHGNGYAIKNLKISSAGNGKGLFGHTHGARITDLTLVNPNVRGTQNIGALIGRSNGTTIERVAILNPEVRGDSQIGGIVGENADGFLSNYITDCYVQNGTINATKNDAGGLVGTAYDMQIENSYFSGTIRASMASFNQNAAGIIGVNKNSRIICKNTASLASSIKGGSASQFIARGNPLVINENNYTRDDMELTPYISEDIGLGRATSEQTKELSVFKTRSFYEGIGWDFQHIWKMPDDGFPVFQWNDDITKVTTYSPSNNLTVYREDKEMVIKVELPASIWIYDVSGKLIKRFDMEDVEKVPLVSGIYMIKSITKNGGEGESIKFAF